MFNLSLVFLCCAVLAASIIQPAVHGIAQDPQSVKLWFEKLPEMKEKVTTLHFYFTDLLSGNNQTACLVAGKNISSTTPIDFSAVMMADDPLTVGPDPSSEEIGRGQGMYSQAAMDEIGFLLNFNLVFTKGEYSGSTLSLVGWNPILHKRREMPIVGGSGVFRLARGIATSTQYSLNATSLNAVVEYQVMVIHY